MSIPNLDGMSEKELGEFWYKYRSGGRNLSKELIGDTRPRFTSMARDLANYAINKSAAVQCRARGDVVAAMGYELVCDRIYKRLPEDLRW